MTQAELEAEMVDGGRAKAMAAFNRNEEREDAAANPYAQAIFRRFVVPMAEGLRTYLTSTQRGVAAKNKVLLRDIDPTVLAYITVRGVLNKTLTEADATLPDTAMALGRTVYGEVLLSRFEDLNPELYFTLVNDLERRMTKSEQHRLAVFRNSASKDGLSLPVWDPAAKADVGMLLAGAAKDVGLIEFQAVSAAVSGKARLKTMVVLSEAIRDLVDQVKGFVAGASPMTMPCVEPPKPWLAVNDGGWHTPGMRRAEPTAIRRAPLGDYEDIPKILLDGLSTLQNVEWRVNAKVLDVALYARTHFDVQDVLISDTRADKPDLPLFMQADPDLSPSDMTPEQHASYKEWCGLAREWHTDQKIRGAHAGSTNESLRMANRFRGRPIWFVYTADYRGRFYASGQGINPQGNDLSKALLEFGKSSPIRTERGRFWFMVAGANRWAQDKIDKAPLEDRVRWSIENEPFILRIADDPLSCRDWCNADVPFQFLAWCFEYADLLRNPDTFQTRLPLGQDGSCNGLQHFSAMLRDEVGGHATNLLPNDQQQDLYDLVARATANLVMADPDEHTLAGRWKLHALSRALVKRSVMTLPYGSTRHSSALFILKEYMAKGEAPEFATGEHMQAATWLSHRVWAGIGEVVIKGREAMEWLQGCADVLTKGSPVVITWTSPSGLRIRQRYNKSEVLRLKCRATSGKPITLTIKPYTGEGCSRRHRNGIAPNFVHGCDASHMHFFLEAAEAAGLTELALVHDDYGCLADDVETLQRLLRETFVWMYENRHPMDLLDLAYPGLPPMPENGTLELRNILDSRYFFC